MSNKLRQLVSVHWSTKKYLNKFVLLIVSLSVFIFKTLSILCDNKYLVQNTQNILTGQENAKIQTHGHITTP